MARRLRQLGRNDLFYRFMLAIFTLLALLGAGLTIVVVTDSGNDALQLRFLNVFAGAFAAFVSFGAGYLYGSAAQATDTPRKDSAGR